MKTPSSGIVSSASPVFCLSVTPVTPESSPSTDTSLVDDQCLTFSCSACERAVFFDRFRRRPPKGIANRARAPRNIARPPYARRPWRTPSEYLRRGRGAAATRPPRLLRSAARELARVRHLVPLGVELRHPVHRRRVLRQELGLLDGLLAAADDADLGVPVEGGVARRAVAHAPSEELALARERRRPAHGARREDERARLDGDVGRVDDLAVALGVDHEHLRPTVVRAVRHGLLAHLVQQLLAAHRLVDARVVGDVVRDG
mmetsp:Transcript_18054/g.55540  ORF Transcript_18054/g.55540 Transcript_18054/m.55540 type:complete len:260 (+) Transcript_18054:293-1072(+)